MDDTNSLQHYGVLGMKWGVRRYQPYPKGRHGTFLGQSRDEDIRISKGTKAYRVQDSDKITGSSQSYISLTKGDHIQYLSAASSPFGGVAVDAWVKAQSTGKNPELYSVRFELTEDIIAPSYQKTMDTFVKTVSEMGGSKVFVRDINNFNEKQFQKDFLKSYSKLKVDDMRDKAYLAFASKFMRNSEAKEKFFSNLQAEGYNAIVDDWDKRFGSEQQYTEAPVIVFNQERSLKKTDSKKLTDADFDLFREAYEYDGSLDMAKASRPMTVGKTADQWLQWEKKN